MAERTAPSQAGSLKSILDKSRDRLKAAVEEIKEVRRTAQDALFYRSEAARLEKRLSEAGVDVRQRSPLTSLRMEVVQWRRDLRAAKAAKDTAAVRPPKTAPTRKADKDTIRALRRDVDSLTRENARQGKKMEALRARNAELQARIARLQSTRSALSQALFGSRSEKQKKKGTGRKRGQQRGTPGPGRPPRPGLGEKKERRNPPKAVRPCSCCGKPHVAHGERSTSLVEIEVRVKAHIRRIARPRRRGGSTTRPTGSASGSAFSSSPAPVFVRCAGSRTGWGTRDWRSRRERWPTASSASCRCSTRSTKRSSRTRTRRRCALPTRPAGGGRSPRSSRAWLWIPVSGDAVYHLIDPSRSAKVAKSRFGDTAGTVYVVGDRYSAYRTLAHELGGKGIVCWCWAHHRRDCVRSVVGHVGLSAGSDGWVERIAEIHRLNEERLAHDDPARALPRQTPAFDAAQAARKTAVERLFADAEAELAGLSAGSRKAKPRRTLVKHREGRCVFLDQPFVPMDNNIAERGRRCAVIRRRSSFGSNSEDGAKCTAIMPSVVGTLPMHGIDGLRWLEAWLTAGAKNGGKPPDGLSPGLPWTMSEAHQRHRVPRLRARLHR